ncbi:hypothetical protein JVT61DRAFT_11438 [Boletus reticuloceps]|uniref:DUF6830 domain-containing protein n=1 Tax=Boletus reticuloceps TaxID=495285 RepID=A0A8I2YV65_9AGAM|nr:hypothetical protein JVT61DRAFT_11438 [Boletus reticuloceps]
MNAHNVSGVRTCDLHCPLPFDHIQIWYKLQVQQYLYHEDKGMDALQTLRAFPPSSDRPHRFYNTVIICPGPDSNWPHRGIEGMHTQLLSSRLHC